MSMREKYQSLALADLKEIAKSRGIKGTSGMKKADIIEAMVALDEEAEGRPGTPVRTEEKGDAADKAAAAPKRAGAGVCLKAFGKDCPGERTAEKPSEVKSPAEKEEEAAPAETAGQARAQNVQQAAPQVQNATSTERAQPQR